MEPDPKEIQSLFEGQFIRLSAIDPDKDAEVEARWSTDPIYQAMIQAEVVRPLSVAEARKKITVNEDSPTAYKFAIHDKSDDRLLGFLEIQQIQWNHGLGWMSIRIGEAGDRHKGYGSDALKLVLHYAFEELNLEHLIVKVPEYNFPAQQFFEKVGFSTEVRQRQALFRFERRWDLLLMGLLRGEWQARKEENRG